MARRFLPDPNRLLADGPVESQAPLDRFRRRVTATDHLHQWLQARFPQLDDTLKTEIGKIG